MTPIFIEAAKRTPMGAFQGSLSQLKAWQLGSALMQHMPVEKIEEVFMGCVLQAGQGQSPARQASLAAGIPNYVPCTTINKVCGYHTQVLAGGMESMTNAPYLLDKARAGVRFGHGKVLDHILTDGLEDAYTKGPDGSPAVMGVLSELVAERYGFTRYDQEAYVSQTYENWQKAQKSAYFSGEIAPIFLDVKGEKVPVSCDEPPQKVFPEKFKNLKPAFKKDGSITAATSSSLADGAAAVVLCSEKNASAPLARIVGYTSFAQDPQWFSLSPIHAIQNLCSRVGWTVGEVDLFEINEAFAVVPMAAMVDLSIPRQKVNIHGGACVMGHPLGASGARIVVTLAHALKTHGLKRGIAAACIGSGEATAIALESV
jgi:acetyl-CoA C-acetyltransferase